MEPIKPCGLTNDEANEICDWIKEVELDDNLEDEPCEECMSSSRRDFYL